MPKKAKPGGIITDLRAAGIDVGELCRSSVFEKWELEELFKAFQFLRGAEEAGLMSLGADFFGSSAKLEVHKAQRGNDITVDVDDLATLPMIAGFPLLRRALLMHKQDLKVYPDELTFPEFVAALSAMSGRIQMQDKLNFAFNLFDVDASGVIRPSELYTLFRELTGRAYSEENLQSIVEGYVRRFPGGVDFDVFAQMFDVSDLSKLILEM